MEINKFIESIPSRLNKDSFSKDDDTHGYYENFFNDWQRITEHWTKHKNTETIAKKACDLVYDTLLKGKPMYKHYEHCMSYEMSDEAKNYYWGASMIYDYVIWLQLKDLFPDKTRIWFDGFISKYLKPMENMNI